MLEFLRKLGLYVLARLEERSTVAGIVGFVVAAAGLVLPAGLDVTIVNAVVGVAGLVAMVIPGGK